MRSFKNETAMLLALCLVQASIARAEFLPYSDPKTKNSAKIETPAEIKVDGRLGSVSYAVAFTTPPGTGGLTPELSVAYSSASEASPYGWGWQLTGLSVIERATRRGPPKYDDLSVCGTKDSVELDGELLVPDPDPSNCRRFHRIMSDFSLIVYDPATDSWTVTRTDGMRMQYGALDSGASPSQSRLHNQDGKTYRWALDQVVDPRGNAYRISYFKANATVGGVQAETQLYPQRIHYSYHVATACHATPTALPGAGRRMLQFEWEDRRNSAADPADRPVSFRAGFRIETSFRLKRVLTGIDENANGVLVPGNGGDLITAQYNMRYADKSKLVGGTPYNEPTSKLVEVQRVGTNGELFPSTTRMEYSEPARQFLPEQFFPYQSGPSGAPFFPILDGDQALLGALGCENRPPDGLGCDSCAIDFATCTPTNRTGCCSETQNDLYRSASKLIDMNGDGVTDRLRIRKTAREWELCPGLPGGNGFGPCVPWTFNGSVKATDGLDFTTDTVGVVVNDSIRAFFTNERPGSPATYFGVHADLIDMDGDGLPDRIEDHYYCEPGETCPVPAPSANDPIPEFNFWSFYRNTGTGFAKKRAWVAPAFRTAYANAFVRSIALYDIASAESKTKARSRLVDVNGDGRPDHVVVDVNGKLHVSMNNGVHFDPEKIVGEIDLPASDPHLSTTNGKYSVDREFMDVNGDGLPDQLLSGGSLGGSGPPAGALEIRFNTGRGFQFSTGTGQLAPDPARLRFTTFGDKVQQTRTRAALNSPTPNEVTSVSETFADFNGDGVLDRVVTSNTDSQQGTTTGTLDIFYGLGDGTFMPQGERWPMPVFRRVNGMTEYVDGVPGIALFEVLDINGDGFMDRLGLDASSTYARQRVYLHPGPRVLLTKVTNEDGGITDLKYAASTNFAPRAVPLTLFGTALGPEDGVDQDQTVDLRRALWILTERRVSDGRGTTTFDRYAYAQPRYDWGRRETVGMRESEVLDEKNLIVRTVYFQRRSLRGRTWYQEQVGNGELLRMSITEWTPMSPLSGPPGCFDGSAMSSCVPVPGSFFPEPLREVMLDFDSRTAGGGTAVHRTKLKTREIDERYGRLETETDYGDLGPDATENTADDKAQTHFKTVMGYAAPNLSAWLVNVPQAKATYSGGVLSGFELTEIDSGAPAPICGLVTNRGRYTGSEAVNDLQKYDEFGNVIEARDPNNIDPAKLPSVRVAYDDRFKSFVVSSTNALGHVNRFATEPRWGNVEKLLGPDGSLGCRQFDGFGRLTRVSRYEARLDPASAGPAGNNAIAVACDTDLQTIAYVSSGNPAAQYVATTTYTGADQFQSRQYFDGLGRTYREAKGAAACTGSTCADFFVTAKSFDKFGREVCMSLPTRGDAGAVGACETLRNRKVDYDIFDRPVATKLSVTNETESTTSYAILDLDGDGALEAVSTTTLLTGGTAAPARVNRVGLDIREQPVAIEETVGSNTKALTRVVRDAKEQIVKVDGPDIGAHPNQLLFSYDFLGRRTLMGKPRTADTLSSGPTWGIVYDKAGNVIRKTSPRGTNFDVAYFYDAIERKVGEDLAPFCAQGAPWANCIGAEDTNIVYDSFFGNLRPGRLVAVGFPGPNGPIVDIFDYNHRGERTAFGRFDNANADVPAVGFNFGYDRQGRLVSETYPDNEILSWQYNGALLSSVRRQLSASAAPEVLVDQLSYHRSGTIEGYRLPQAGVTGQRRFVEKDDRLERIDVTRGASEVLLGLGFRYDLAGNLQNIDMAASGAIAAGTQTFTYDPLHRLARAVDTRPSGYGTSNSAYSPLTSANLTTLGSFTLTYGQNNQDPSAVTQLVDGTNIANNRTFGYDADGNLTARVLPNNTRDTLTWNPYGRLTRYVSANGTTGNYWYDSNGERLLKRVTSASGTVVTHRLKPAPDFEIDLVSRTRTKHVMLSGVRMMSIESSGLLQGAERSRIHFHRDQLDQPVVLSDQTGAVLQRNVFSPFGSVKVEDKNGAPRPIAQSLTPYLFGDYEFDSESGLYYGHARYYDSSLGRFISYDPRLANRASGGAQLLDPYSFADNRPTVSVDGDAREPRRFDARYWGQVAQEILRPIAEVMYPDDEYLFIPPERQASAPAQPGPASRFGATAGDELSRADLFELRDTICNHLDGFHNVEARFESGVQQSTLAVRFFQTEQLLADQVIEPLLKLAPSDDKEAAAAGVVIPYVRGLAGGVLRSASLVGVLKTEGMYGELISRGIRSSYAIPGRTEARRQISLLEYSLSYIRGRVRELGPSSRSNYGNSYSSTARR